jgi:hypothetical protein
MLVTFLTLALSSGVLTFSFTGYMDDDTNVQDAHAVAVRLKLNALEVAVIIERYEDYIRSQAALEETIQALQAAGAPLAKSQEMLKSKQSQLLKLQSKMSAARKRLVGLESETAKLKRILGKAPGAAPAEGDHTLNKILDRLSAIEKRLEKLERRK